MHNLLYFTNNSSHTCNAHIEYGALTAPWMQGTWMGVGGCAIGCGLRSHDLCSSSPLMLALRCSGIAGLTTFTLSLLVSAGLEPRDLNLLDTLLMNDPIA